LLLARVLDAEGATPGDDDGRPGAIDLLEHTGYVAHHVLEGLGHVVQGAVGVHDRVFEQTVGIDVGQQS
jgi:hypothetical protein